MNYRTMQIWSVEDYHDLFQKQGLIPKPEEERMEIVESAKKKMEKHQQLLLAAEKRQKAKLEKKMGYEDTDTEWHITRYKKGKENDAITVQQQRQKHHGTKIASNNLIKDNEPEVVVRKFKRDNTHNNNNHQQENKEEFRHREAKVQYTISIDEMASDETRQEHGNNDDKNTPEKEIGVDASILLADETIFGDNSEERTTWWVLHFVKKYLTCQF